MCLNPLRCRLNPDGGRPLLDKEGDFSIGCGKCIECVSKRALDWALRAKHELSLHKENCFITLTYDDEHLPSHLIVKDKFKRFIERLRYFTSYKFSYMVSHEYGTKTLRPHHHAIIFGWTPSEQKYLKTTKSGYPLTTSDDLSELWKYGYHSIGEANPKTAYYIASYALSGKERELLDPNGEIINVCDSMDVSKRPGIGLKYLELNAVQLAHSKTPLPRYYIKKLEQYYPDLFEVYQNNQLENLANSVRGDHQVYAKQVIAQQKKALFDGEYRKTPINPTDEYLDRNLKSTRDNYQARKKEKK